jgi:hypothetical protein
MNNQIQENPIPLERQIIVISADSLLQLLKDFFLPLIENSQKEQSQDPNELTGTAEACKILGCCPKTMQSYRNRKLFNVVMRDPKKALYYRSEVLAFREANTRKSNYKLK